MISVNCILFTKCQKQIKQWIEMQRCKKIAGQKSLNNPQLHWGAASSKIMEWTRARTSRKLEGCVYCSRLTFRVRLQIKETYQASSIGNKFDFTTLFRSLQMYACSSLPLQQKHKNWPQALFSDLYLYGIYSLRIWFWTVLWCHLCFLHFRVLKWWAKNLHCNRILCLQFYPVVH